jgi:hypothetical protein
MQQDAAVLACVEEGTISLVGVVLVAHVSCRVGVATCAHMNVLVPASCRQVTVPNVLRNLLVRHVHNTGKLPTGELGDV